MASTPIGTRGARPANQEETHRRTWGSRRRTAPRGAAPKRTFMSGLKPEPSRTPRMMIMPWRSCTRMPTRSPANAATVVNMQEPNIQASGILSQLKTTPPTPPIAIARITGLTPAWPMMCLRSGLNGTSFSPSLKV